MKRLEQLLLLIDEIQDDIFAYRIEKVSSTMIRLAEGLTGWIKTLSSNEQTVVNPVLKAIIDSYAKKDFLLVADLLEFELKPLLNVRELG